MSSEFINIDFQNIRIDRQKYNNEIVVKSIINDDKKLFNENINQKEYKRTLEDLGIKDFEFWKKCKEDKLFLKISARLISKTASRQGNKDEELQLKICNIIAKKCDINIIMLSKTEYRPTKEGKIISCSEMKKKNITKDQCLKSFDAKIIGKLLNGWISAKISFGSGRHQDNVFEEEDTLCKWWCDNMNVKKENLVILIDTNIDKQMETLKKKYFEQKNIIIVNHYQFQEYMFQLFNK